MILLAIKYSESLLIYNNYFFINTSCNKYYCYSYRHKEFVISCSELKFFKSDEFYILKKGNDVALHYLIINKDFNNDCRLHFDFIRKIKNPLYIKFN